ncbi:MAG: hypothetical protein LBQ61_04715 [Spirochaetales bacterium]|jgi:tetratricopeptide (TPR) repeat protein|nr:hypothetical protein [Spirochaetales bacterium]
MIFKKRAGIFVLILQLFLTGLSSEENYKGTYLELLRSGNYEELAAWLRQWEEAEPENPEMFIGYFNYFVRSGAEVVQSVVVENGRRILRPRTQYNPENVNVGITYLDRGLQYTPHRLDIYWGKIELLMETGNYAKAGETLSNLIEISRSYNDQWLLGDNRPVSNGESYFLNYIIRYYSKCMDAYTEAPMEMLRGCSEKHIEVYPQDAYGYFYLASYYHFADQKEQSLHYFLLSEKINPSDCLTLLNIARLYLDLNNPEGVRAYAQRVLSIGNNEEKRYARYLLGQLE